jgi:hypothetical protein
MYLPHRCVPKSSARTTENAALLFLRKFASAGPYLPNRCLAINYPGFQGSCHNMYKIEEKKDYERKKTKEEGKDEGEKKTST